MVRISAIDTQTVRRLQAGGPDANGQVPERAVSDGKGVPCRHCLEQVEAGAEYLIVSHCPFPEPQPYAEKGPVFLHARECERHVSNGNVPAMLESPAYMIRGYNAQNRIVYGTGKIVPTQDLASAAAEMFADDAIEYAHVRSAENNCFQFRVERDQGS